jgi:hypothetical protein
MKNHLLEEIKTFMFMKINTRKKTLKCKSIILHLAITKWQTIPLDIVFQTTWLVNIHSTMILMDITINLLKKTKGKITTKKSVKNTYTNQTIKKLINLSSMELNFYCLISIKLSPSMTTMVIKREMSNLQKNFNTETKKCQKML